ncbi:hypothetical protein VTO42DRAFT_7815 [Malbranchea cinnamomea]
MVLLGFRSGDSHDGSATRKRLTCRTRKCRDLPDALSFDNIINGYTCSPCTVRDFMDYLLYVERAAENLQFFLWYRDYKRRFAHLPPSQRSLSPEWTKKPRHAQSLQSIPQDDPLRAGASSSSLPRRDIEPRQRPSSNASISAAFDDNPPSSRESMSSSCPIRQTRELGHRWEQAKPENGSGLHPNSSQPFRMETSRIIATYIVDGSPRQLNITAEERGMLLHALETTTHPSAFKQVADTVEWHLRQQSHPNFIRWAMVNSSGSRKTMARVVSTAAVIAGLIVGIVPIFSSAGRAWRAMSAVVLVPSIASTIIAWGGSCFVMICVHRRHLHPWEFFTELDEDDALGKPCANTDAFDAFGEANSYEDAPWIPKYKERHFFQRVFDPETRIEDPALKHLQTATLLRSIGLSIIISAAIVGALVAIPNGNFF